ncbi:glycosyltransferase family 4 protein [Saccharothrix syringae]|uniref:Glycosyltransferase n=1 Tax=Saccharothrix syringae TaxID=103733 RepID=A0A5Q0GUI6_SACSY|nr:glycosyltransferase family 4 protein [Saccharothrix syringae]QFZ17737.1 glycosyltransferase [Saccharothrix syringae]
MANLYHGIGTQTRYLISCLGGHRAELVDAVGEFDVHLLVPDASYSRPGYAVDEAMLAANRLRVEAADITLWELAHDDSRLFHIDKWHQVSAEAARVVSVLAERYDEVLVVAVDAIYCVVGDHLDRLLTPGQWERTSLVYTLYSSSRIPGTTQEPGRDEGELAAVMRANTDPRVFFADVGTYFSAHLVEDFGLDPTRLRPFIQALSLDDPELQRRDRAEALEEVRSWNIPLDRPIVLSMGRADPIKGLDRAIRAVTPLRERLHFVLIAAPYTPEDAEIRKYRTLLAESGLRHTLVPRFDRTLPRSLCSLHETAAVLSASLGEPCGQVPQEAALWAQGGGPVVIVPDEGGLAAQIIPGTTGFVFPQGDIGAMTRMVETVLDQTPEERDRMRAAATRKVLQERDFTRSLGTFLKSVWGVRQAVSHG